MRIHYKGDEIDGYRPRKAPHQMSDTAPIQHPSWLTTGDFTAADEPLRLFTAWLTEATASEPRDPTAMTLATVDSAGLPNARMVLLKGSMSAVSSSIPTWTAKRAGIDAQLLAALVFYWKSVNRQGCAPGSAHPVTDA
jgi:pyridoxamine 5'-phosphate oxidase